MKIITITLLFISSLTFGQTINNKQLTPVGAIKSFTPNVTVANSNANEYSLLGSIKDTIQANTLIPYRPYRFELYCIVTTPAISLPTLGIKVTLGGNTIATLAPTIVGGGLTNAGLRIRGFIVSTGISSQMVLTEILQPNGLVVSLGNTNGTFYKEITANMANNQVLDVVVAWGGVTLGTASIKSVYYYRPDF